MGIYDTFGNGISYLMNAAFGWSIPISPYFAILLVTIVLTFISTLVYKYTSDQIRLKSIKEEMDGLKSKMKDAKGNVNKTTEYNSKITELSLEQMKHSVFNWKYMIITLIPLGLAFSWLRSTFGPMNLWGTSLGYLWVYLIFSLFVSQFIRKIFKVY